MADASPPRIETGCSGLPPGLSRRSYFARLAYLETADTLEGLPGRAALRKWREDLPAHATFGLVAPRAISHRPDRKGYGPKLPLSPEQLARAGEFRDTDVVREAVDQLAEAAALVGAQAVIFRSPPTVSPSAAFRDRLRRFFAEIAPAERFPGAARVWRPEGLWEPRAAARLAAELGVVFAGDPLAFDPLDADSDVYTSLPGDAVYFNVTGLGRAESRLDDMALEVLLELAGLYGRAWVVFEHPGKYPDCIKFRQMLDSAPATD